MSSLKSIIFYISVILPNYHLVTSKKMNVTAIEDTFVSARDEWDYFNKGGQKRDLVRDLGMGVLHIINIKDKIYEQFSAQQILEKENTKKWNKSWREKEIEQTAENNTRSIGALYFGE